MPERNQRDIRTEKIGSQPPGLAGEAGCGKRERHGWSEGVLMFMRVIQGRQFAVAL